MIVADVMKTNLIVARVEDTVASAAALLESLEIRHLPVVEGKRLIGMVSDRDLRDYRLPVLEELESPTQADAMGRTPIVEVMRGDVIAVEPDEPLSSVLDIMIETKVGAVPVLARPRDELVGIVSYIDLLLELRVRVTAEELED